MARTKQPPFAPAQVERLSKILADTDTGLTGSEIERVLGQSRIKDVDPTSTKWKRLFNALATHQNADRSGDCVLSFIHHSLAPARYTGNRSGFEARRTQVNAVLAMCGLEFRSDGRFHRVSQAVTLEEAEARAQRLRSELSGRGVHADVVAACRAELLEDNCFHAVLEATKSVATKLRSRTGLTSDGASLVDEALGGGAPRLKINPYQTESEQGEQRGFGNLVKGLFGVFRNPTAHEPRTAWKMSEPDALDLFTLASYVHRRLDASQ